ncbi:MAG: glucosamine-6-phosphate deaminase [Clostridia bacterium]|nr:glucosamine-6-phosphate deaminase [Clostridia bacterium]
MKFIEVETYAELSRLGADIIAEVIKSKDNPVLGLATGSSPVGIYENLVKKNKAGLLDFSKVVSVNLDEYLGLDGDHEQSYRYFMNDNLFNHVNIDKANTYVPNGKAEDIVAECEAYDKRLQDFGGSDIQLLGIGLDGHIGFNEPDDCFTAQTHVVELDPSTIEANARFFESKDMVPRKAVTMGMAGIMQSKKILIIANGAAKRDILMTAMYGKITPEVPASILQLHPDVTVIYSKN